MMADLKVQGRSSHRTGVANSGNHFAPIDAIAFHLEDLFQMGIHGVVMISVVNNHHVAEPLKPARIYDMPIRDGTNGFAPFGLDAGDPGFWSRGLAVIEGLIDELEAMEA